MGSSAKKKREKKQDFQKTKLKVGKARPKNTNATDTSFSAKSIVFKQQNLSETARDDTILFNNNLSLLSSRNESQRKDALTFLVSAASNSAQLLPQPASVIISKAQPLVLDGNSNVRQQVLKLFKSLQQDEIGAVDQLLLYSRAGMTHLSSEIRLSSLDVFDWLITTHGQAILACAGGWVKTLFTFRNLLNWTTATAVKLGVEVNGTWSATRPAATLGSSKLRVHQITSLAHFLDIGLQQPSFDHGKHADAVASMFPIWEVHAHLLPIKSHPFSNLNLFGVQRDAESEIYDDPEERKDIFLELGLLESFGEGVKEAKKEGGEIGRAAALVDKALNLVADVER